MSGELTPVRSTGIGSWPGTDMADAIKITFAECPDFPYLPELPARGAHAQMIGRATAFLAGMAADLQPEGWRLTDGSGRDHRLAISLLREDLDRLEEHAQGYAGPLKFAVTGPWTLSAMVERPRGDKVLADHGARRDLAQSLAEGVAQLIMEMRRRLPDIEPIVQLDEPLLPRVLAGGVPTASGFSRHRVVDLPEASTAISQLINLLHDTSGTATAVHCCAADAPIELLQQAGASAVMVDLDQLRTRDWDALGPALEAGLQLGAGALPTDRLLSADDVARKALKPIREIGIDPEIAAEKLIITPACGLSGRTRDSAIRALRTIRTAAGIVTEQLAD